MEQTIEGLVTTLERVTQCYKDVMQVRPGDNMYSLQSAVAAVAAVAVRLEAELKLLPVGHFAGGTNAPVIRGVEA